jgi:hypothetical protein
VYSKLFLARLLLVLERCHGELDRLIDFISDASQWIASDHNALLSE